MIVAPAVAALLLVAFTRVALAECGPGSLPRVADDPLTVGAAFLATVTEASSDVDPNPDGNAYDWHLELAVDATYVGSVPRTFVLNVWNGGGCGDFKGEALRTGDRIIVAAEALDYTPGAPLGGHLVIWKKTAEDWAFFADALTYGAEPDAYPKVARDADTKAEILQAISDGALPATSTDTDRSALPQRSSIPITAIAFASALGIAWHVLGSRRPRPLK